MTAPTGTELLAASLKVGYLQGQLDHLEGYGIGSRAYMTVLRDLTTARLELARIKERES